jgi:predicted alpha/beta superfamily hydrolase
MQYPTFEQAGFHEWWEILPPGHHTIHGTVKINPAVDSPELGNERRVWLRLPSSYFHSTASYPAIVMHDGQNLFDEATSFIGQEWRVDETLLELEPAGLEAIVIGVDNMAGSRHLEYVPWGEQSRAEEYVSFLCDTLLPLVERACGGRVRRSPTDTAVIGSSLGGLISLYAFTRRPDVFGLCGSMSPSTWHWGQQIPTLVQRHRAPRGRVYVDNGDRRQGDRGSNGGIVAGAFERIGYRGGQDLLYVQDNQAHTEAAWAKRLPEALRFLYEVGTPPASARRV